MKFRTNPGIPSADEYAEYYGQYLKFAGDETDIADVLAEQVKALKELVANHPTQLQQVHSPYTWSVTQAVGHLCDQERVFGNRAARFAAGDLTSLPGYDQAVMGNGGGYERCEPGCVVEEFENLRRANQLLFARLDEEQWGRRGLCDERLLSVRAIAYLLAGHFRYHFAIFQQRLQPA
ncbi:MAG: DinB family protein [Planctomycetaceae bacterium]